MNANTEDTPPIDFTESNADRGSEETEVPTLVGRMWQAVLRTLRKRRGSDSAILDSPTSLGALVPLPSSPTLEPNHEPSTQEEPPIDLNKYPNKSTIEMFIKKQDIETLNTLVANHPKILEKYVDIFFEIINRLELTTEQQASWLRGLTRGENAYTDFCERALRIVSKLTNFDQTVLKEFIWNATVRSFGSCGIYFARAFLEDRENTIYIIANMTDPNIVKLALQNLDKDSVPKKEMAKFSRTHLENLIFVLCTDPNCSDLIGEYGDRMLDFIKLGLRMHPDAIRVFDTIEMTEDQKVTFAKLLLKKDIFIFRDNEEEAIAKTVTMREKAMEMLEKIAPERQQEVFPLLMEHLVDIDLGDIELARQVVGRIEDVKLREAEEVKIPESLDDLRRTPEKIRAKFADNTGPNAQRIYEEAVAHSTQADIDERVADIEQSHFYSVNVSLEALQAILESGRIQSNWESIGRYHSGEMCVWESKESAKNKTERFLGIRGKGTKKDPHPIYATMGHTNGTEENVGSAVFTIYGTCHIKIDPKFVEETALFTYGDSMTANMETPKQQDYVRSIVLDKKGAAIGKANLEVNNEVRKQLGYVEAILIQGVNTEQFVEIVIPQAELDGSDIKLEDLQAKAPGIRFKVI